MESTQSLPPLAERMRPVSLEEYVGQGHLVGSGGPIRRMIDQGRIFPFILWGAPGVGKTTLARLLSASIGRDFFSLSAVHSGVKDIRGVVDRAERERYMGALAPILFIDEIHRFSKSQQDSLLGAVENGTVVLVGATTENPSFEVISPLLSRCQVYVLQELTREDLAQLYDRAVSRDVLLSKVRFRIDEDQAFYGYANGDGRRLLNILELLYNARVDDEVVITNALVEGVLQTRSARYDKQGDMHYDVISAFIKSVRGSDPNASLYWLARMLQAGEDVVFIARRLVILAAEDVGLANPNGLLMANAAMEAVRSIGMPEARIVLAEAVVYLASSPKSNSAYRAIDAALALAEKDGVREVPLHLRNANTALMRKLGYGEGYRYAHDYQDHFVQQEYLPTGLEGTLFYEPQRNPREAEARRWLRHCWGDKYYKE